MNPTHRGRPDSGPQTFAHVFSSQIRSAAPSPRLLTEGECRSAAGTLCSLCHGAVIDYPTEVRLKNAALQKYWKSLRLSVALAPLVPSPLGRNYRTTTKRRVFPHRDSVELGLISPTEEGRLKPFPVVHCAIEPVEHSAIYAHLQDAIVKPHTRSLARVLTYVIIKGTYAEQTIIFRVKDISTDVVRTANTLSKSLTRTFPSVIGVFLYEDATHPQYYMGSKRRGRQPVFRKLYGKAEIFHRVLGRSFLFSPLSFSQVNHSILETLLEAARKLLHPSKAQRLFDLYCGYGLFALCLADRVEKLVGAEADSASVEAAYANARRQKVTNARFIAAEIDGETIRRIMQTARANDIVLLDPPRSGTSDGVLEYIAATSPARVLHIFCEIDVISKELHRWSRCGYTPLQAIPFDMFPGTPTVETLVLLVPARH